MEKLLKFKALSLDTSVVDKIISTGDVNAAFLYMCIMSGKDYKAREVLGQDKYSLALLSLTEQPTKETPKNIINKTHYNIFDINNARTDDNKFMAICDTAEMVLSKPLSKADLSVLLNAYDNLKLPAEVIIELLSYLKSRNKKLSRSDIEKGLYTWSDMGIYTYELATDYISSRTNTEPKILSIFNEMGFIGRTPTEKEEKYIEDFLKLGFSEEVILFAYTKMLTTKNKFSWSYLAKILENWHLQKLYTLNDINKAQPPKSKINIKSETVPDRQWLDYMEKELERINGQ